MHLALGSRLLSSHLQLLLHLDICSLCCLLAILFCGLLELLGLFVRLLGLLLGRLDLSKYRRQVLQREIFLVAGQHSCIMCKHIPQL